MKFGERLRKARKTAGLTQVELATKSGVSQAHISTIEAGSIQSSSAITRIAEILKVSPLWLAEGRGPQNIVDLANGIAATETIEARSLLDDGSKIAAQIVVLANEWLAEMGRHPQAIEPATPSQAPQPPQRRHVLTPNDNTNSKPRRRVLSNLSISAERRTKTG